MPILDLQTRSRELGRIRIGQVQLTSGGKTRPAKLDRFRLTSASRPLLEEIASLYGGVVAEWQPQGGGPGQFEVVTTSTRLPVLVPPQPVSQFYETWSGGGCQRRCDGITELLTDRPCLCGPDPAERLCKPTTRLNVILRDVPGIGVWRLETHGYYAAVELPQAAVFLAQAGGYVNGWLALEARRVKRDGQTRDFMVPTLEIDVTPAQLLAGQGGTAPTAVMSTPSPVAAIEPPSSPAPDWAAMLADARTGDDIRSVWHAAGQVGALTDDLKALLTARAQQLTAALTSAPAVSADPDELWMLIVAAAPEGWTTSQLEDDFAASGDGTFPGSASAEQLTAYLQRLKAGAS